MTIGYEVRRSGSPGPSNKGDAGSQRRDNAGVQHVGLAPRTTYPRLPRSRRRGREGVRARRAAALARPLIVLGVVLAPLLVPPLAGNSVPADLPNAILILLTVITFWGAGSEVRLPLGFSYLLVLVGGVIGLVHSVAPGAAGVAIIQDAYLFLWFVALVNFMLEEPQRMTRLVAGWWTLTGLVMAFVVWLPTLRPAVETPYVFGFPLVDIYGRSYGTFRDPNLAANYLAISMLVMWAAPRPRSRMVKALLSVPFLLGIYATQSITGLAVLGAGVGLTFAVWLIVRARVRIAASLVVVALMVMVLALLPANFIGESEKATEELGQTELLSESVGRVDTSLGARVARWQESLRLFGDDILVGIGPSTSDEALEDLNSPYAGELHMDYLAALIERGVLGFVGIMTLFGIALWWAVQIGTDRSLVRAGWFSPALAGAILVVLVSALSLETLHFRHVWLLFALVAALWMTKEEPTPLG